MPTVTYGIANTADDVLSSAAVGLDDQVPVNGDGSALFGLPTGSVLFSVGFRFITDASAPPQGATIESAVLRLTRNTASPVIGFSGTAWGLLRALLSANAAPWTTTPPESATKTTQSVTITSDVVKDYDVTAMAQVVVNLPGWTPGNAIAFAGDPMGANGTIEWIDRASSSSDCAQLIITWSTGGTDITPPTITSSATPSVVEGSALSHALTANETVTWAIVGGADAALFSLAGSTLSLPAQTYPSGPYAVVVRATDTAGNETDQTITVSITEAPPFSFIGAATGTTSATIPTHQAGDLILCWAYRDGSNTLPTLPSGQNWTTLNGVTGANTNSAYLVGKIATSSSEATGTFTSATSLIVAVYRPKAGYTLSSGSVAASTAASTTVSYAALSIAAGSGVVAFAGHRSTNTALESPPAGMVLRATVADATDEAAAFDTNGPVSSWGGASVSVGGSSSGWRSVVVEIIATAVVTARPTFQAFIID